MKAWLDEGTADLQPEDSPVHLFTSVTLSVSLSHTHSLTHSPTHPSIHTLTNSLPPSLPPSPPPSLPHVLLVSSQCTRSSISGSKNCITVGSCRMLSWLARSTPHVRQLPASPSTLTCAHGTEWHAAAR